MKTRILQEGRDRMNYCLTKQEVDERVAEFKQRGVNISWYIMQLLLDINSMEELQELRTTLMEKYVLKK